MAYTDIQKIYRMELKSPSLQKIPENFYPETSTVLLELEDADHKKYLKKLIDEIYRRRRNKIVLHALRTGNKETPPTNVTSSELDFYHKIVDTLDLYKSKILSEKQQEEEIEKKPDLEEKSEVIKKVKVKFLRALPAIMGSDSIHYGPFKEDDIVEIPEDNARILVEQEMAEEA